MISFWAGVHCRRHSLQVCCGGGLCSAWFQCFSLWLSVLCIKNATCCTRLTLLACCALRWAEPGCGCMMYAYGLRLPVMLAGTI